MHYRERAGGPFAIFRIALFYAASAAAVLVLIYATAPFAGAQSQRTASLPPPSAGIVEEGVPSQLSAEDAFRYRRALELQRGADWAGADRALSAVKDRLLVGHVLAERYRAHGYRASYAELAEWLRLYGEEPPARAIYGLALQRRPPGAPAPALPAGSGAGRGGSAALPSLAAAFGRQPAPGALAARLPEPDLDGLAEAPPPSRQRDAIGERGHGGAGFETGLAAWRQGRYAEAQQHFEAAAKTRGASAGQVAAAAFWAARAALRAHHPEQVDRWLGAAAEHPHT